MAMNSFVLKIIAVLSMVIDHVGAIFFPQYVIFRVVGRIAFPIFAYTLVEGFMYTHDLRKYIFRMSILALISEIPFDLANFGKILEFSHQNVFFTLTLGLVMLYFFIQIPGNIKKYSMVVLMLLISEIWHTDYSSMGLLMILCFYLFRDRIVAKIVSVCVINCLLMGYIQVFGILALIPICLHNRKQGPKAKTFFYAFYPVHLLLLYVIKMIL